MPLPAIIFGSFFVLLVIGGVLIVLNAVRRSREGSARIEQQGWQRLPEGSDVMPGWDGWPFLIATKPGSAEDIVTGEVDGVEFMSLRWTQLEPPHGAGPGDELERYNIVALRCEAAVPPFSAIRGDHKVKRWEQHEAAQAFEIGADRFDRRWQLLGDADAGRALLVPEVQQVLEDIGVGAWVFQPGWAVRVTKWTFWAGDDGMMQEVRHAAAPWRKVPAEAWAAYGGQPAFVTRLRETPSGGTPETGPGRGWD